MIAFTYAMLPSEDMFISMIAPADGQLYKSVVQRVYSAPNAFERLPTWKELYKKQWLHRQLEEMILNSIL